MPIFGEKHLKIFFSKIKKVSRLYLGIMHPGLKVYQVQSNDNPRMTFDLSMARSNLQPHTLVWGKCGNTGRKFYGICRYAMAVLLR